VFLPKATPAAIVAKLNAAIRETVNTAAVRKRLQDAGLVVVGPERQTPDYLARFVGDEVRKWTPAVKASGAGE
jgi:tripartite-type tricarboxylate transporter receptor subunit TctC